MLQIHIGGAKRAGKTTLARSLASALYYSGKKTTVLDVDEVRTEIFGSMVGIPDSEESMRYHLWTMDAIFNALIPRVVALGGIPITVAGHSRRDQFERAVEISAKLQTDLRFLIVEAPSLEEVAERAKHLSPDDRTDMRDFADPRIQKSFLDATARIEATYSLIRDFRIYRISQGSPEAMVSAALKSLGF